jgi:hypothetical protein
MLRIAFGSILLISGLTGQLALVGESASRLIALGGAILAMLGLVSMLRTRAASETDSETAGKASVA